MPNDASSANNMLIGTMHPRIVEIDIQPVAIPYTGNRYLGAFPLDSKADEVSCGFHRVLHEVD